MVVESRSLGWYECQHCEARWSDADRDMALRRGVWLDGATGLELMDCLREVKPMSIAFHVPARISTFISLSAIAAKGLQFELTKAEDVDKDLCKNFRAEPWEERHAVRAEDSILALRDDRPSGPVPGGGQTAGLVATVDTQDNGFVYKIRAFGWGIVEE